MKRNLKYTYWLSGALFLLVLVMAAWGASRAFMSDLVRQNMVSLGQTFATVSPKLFLILILFLIIRLLSYLVIEILFKKIAVFNYRKSDLGGIASVLKLILWVVFVIMSLGILFENVGALLTSLGLVGFGITFALQKPILNAVGWLNILFRGIYKAGDRIKIGTVKGDVKEINVMNTVLYGVLPTSDQRSNKIVTIPNELVLTADVENYTQEGLFLVEELGILLTYESDFARAQQLLHEVAVAVQQENRDAVKKSVIQEKESNEKKLIKLGERLLSNERAKNDLSRFLIKQLEARAKQLDKTMEELEEEYKPRVRLEMRDSGLDLLLYFETPYDRKKATRTKIFTGFLEAIKGEKNVKIAYPHMQVLLQNKKFF